jgi:hypothetical protein
VQNIHVLRVLKNVVVIWLNMDVFCTMTVLAKLLVKETSLGGYTTYVFQCLEKEAISYSKYIMCTRYPNWEHRNLEIGEIGYLDYKEILAGIDKWFDGEKMVPYQYDGVQFNKFIKKPEETDQKYVM